MESVADLRSSCVRKSKRYVTGMARCHNAMIVWNLRESWMPGKCEELLKI